MSGAASLPGAELFPENRLFVEETTCPGQLRCLGQNCFQKIDFSLKKQLVPGSFAAWGRTFSRISTFLEEATCPKQLRCLGQNFSSISCFLKKNNLSRAASLPGPELFQKIHFFKKIPLVLGSFAAWSRTFSRKLCFVLKRPLVPGSFAAGGSFFPQKSDFF